MLIGNSRIKPELESGNNVMVVAHGHSLRGLVRHIDNLTSEQIQLVGIPNGIPMVYKFDLNMKPIVQNNSELPLSGEYLEKKGMFIYVQYT
jgi:bisphosphoglycerate-dependent phosphoglycerate mutase